MNELPKLGSEQGGPNVHFWVVAIREPPAGPGWKRELG